MADLKQQVEMLIQSQMTEHTEQIEIQKSLPSKGLGIHTGKVLLDENTKVSKQLSESIIRYYQK